MLPARRGRVRGGGARWRPCWGWGAAEVDDAVAVGRSAAEEAAFHDGLGGHGGADPDADADAGAFAFAHAAEDGHDQVVGFAFRVDGAADLGDPELDSVVDEEGERQALLVAVERALGFADDDRVEAAVRVLQRGQQCCFGTSLPGDRP